MKETVHFTKMQGAGNDYIYVDTQLYDIPNPEKAAIAWSAYHTGIGSDGLVLIGKPQDGRRADYSMRIFNADGSEAMMCGNASRCIGKYLYEKGLTRKETIRLETLSGIKILKLHLQDNKKVVDSVTVDMLKPRLEIQSSLSVLQYSKPTEESSKALTFAWAIRISLPSWMTSTPSTLPITARYWKETRLFRSAATSNSRRLLILTS